jgi:hypothetical protein
MSFPERANKDEKDAIIAAAMNPQHIIASGLRRRWWRKRRLNA